MALSAKIGQLKTRIIVKRLEQGCDDDGFPTEEWVNPFPSFIWCQWHNNEGSNRDEDDQLHLRQFAQLTVRYSPLIDHRCRVWLATDEQDDAHAWEVITVNNADLQNRYCDVKLRRVVVA